MLVAVPHQPTARAHLRPHAERLLDALRAGGTLRQDAPTVLARERSSYRHHVTPGTGCLGLKDGAKWGPSALRDGRRQVGIAHHVADR